MCLFLLFAILLVRTADRKYTGGSVPHERNGFRKRKKKRKKWTYTSRISIFRTNVIHRTRAKYNERSTLVRNMVIITDLNLPIRPKLVSTRETHMHAGVENTQRVCVRVLIRDSCAAIRLSVRGARLRRHCPRVCVTL